MHHPSRLAECPDFEMLRRIPFSVCSSATKVSATKMSLSEFKQSLADVLSKESKEKGAEQWTDIVQHIAAFGPRRTGPNILIDATGKCSKL